MLHAETQSAYIEMLRGNNAEFTNMVCFGFSYQTVQQKII